MTRSEKQESEKYDNIKAVMESTGTTFATQAQGLAGQTGGFSIERRTISYRQPSVMNDDDVAFLDGSSST